MTQPTEYQLAAATRAGRRMAAAGRPVTDCPYPAGGTPTEKVLARRFVRAYLAERGADTGDAA